MLTIPSVLPPRSNGLITRPVSPAICTRGRADGDEPWDTINRAPSTGAHLGFPHCYVTADSRFNASQAAHLAEAHVSGYEPTATHDAQVAWCSEQAFTPGTAIGYHSAPLGVSFFDENRLLIAERGAFGGSTAGHQISTVRSDLTGFEPLIKGFINDTSAARWGRPVDVQMQPSTNAFFVSDDLGGTILRFDGWTGA